MKITVKIPVTVSAEIAVTGDTNLDFLKQDIQHVVKSYMVNWLHTSSAIEDIPNQVQAFTNWDVGEFEITID